MTKDNGDPNGQVSRRDFLTLASSALALTVTDYVVSPAFGAEQPSETNLLDTGGIAMVSKLTLTEKISQFGSSAPAVERIGLPAFDYGAAEYTA